MGADCPSRGFRRSTAVWWECSVPLDSSSASSQTKPGSSSTSCSLSEQEQFVIWVRFRTGKCPGEQSLTSLSATPVVGDYEQTYPTGRWYYLKAHCCPLVVNQVQKEAAFKTLFLVSQLRLVSIGSSQPYRGSVAFESGKQDPFLSSAALWLNWTLCIDDLACSSFWCRIRGALSACTPSLRTSSCGQAILNQWKKDFEAWKVC